MKKRATITLAAVLFLAGIVSPVIPARAESDIVTTTLNEDGSTNTWSQADLQAALQLLNRKYHRDMGSKEGRRKWHGMPSHSIATNAETRIIESVETYPDGFVFRDPGERRKLHTPEEEAAWFLAQRERRASARLTAIERLRERIIALEAKRTSTNELEAAHAIIELAAARKRLARLETEQTTNIVNVVVQPGVK